MRYLSAALAALALVAVPAAGAADGDDPQQRIRDALARTLPDLEPERIEETPVDGLYAVMVGAHVLYVSEDGRFVIRKGEMIDVEGRRNLTEESRRSSRLSVMGTIPESSLITFAPEEPRHVVTVFTDVDCPYCARLHEEMAGYNALGITVRYAAFPRAGIPSQSYDKTVSVWCAEDPHEAIGEAKAGRPVEPRECENPVASHYEAGQLVGIRGTPAFVLDDGSVVPGYLPPKRLAGLLDGG